jgi:glycosyltransferase involved in cell wall biosynthesis
MEPTGGGEVVAAWMLQALQERYDVTLLTWVEPDFAALNRMFGTRIDAGRVKIVRPPAAARFLVDRIPDEGYVQAVAYLLRTMRRMRGSCDAVIASTTMECDLGPGGMQYIHYPYLGQFAPKLTTPGDASALRVIQGLWRGATRPWMVVAGYDFSRVATSRVLTNSASTAAVIQHYYGLSSQVVYPPAPGSFPDVPWKERAPTDFYTAGRLHPGKRQDWIIGTLAEVRKSCPEVRLHIVGIPDALSATYEASVRDLVRENRAWVDLHVSIPRSDLSKLAARCRYTIHAMVDEHFGIAPAEGLLAGCIPFVHASGGQVEIVGNHPALCFDSREDAVEKIVRVLRDEQLQGELRDFLQPRAELFMPVTFMRRVLEETEALLTGGFSGVP